jgi:hypothetical protein
MNLIQVQDDLRQLPNTPQTLQLLAQYANGMNPTVPPYVALGELQSRNKRMQQLAQQQQAGQQPQGTVSEQVQQQAMGMAAQQPQQAQPQAQPQPQPPQAGIAGLPVQDNVTNFGSGGIVAFKEAGAVNDAVEAAKEAENDDDDDEATTGEYLKPSREILAKLEAQAENLRRQKAPSPGESPEVARARLAKENPDLFGSLVKPIGGDVESRLAELQKAQAAEYGKQREEAQKAKPSLFQQLGEAAIGSRGQYGRSGLASILGGYSSIANKQEQQALEQEQGLRMKELGLQQAKMDVLNKLDEARRAHAEGRFDDEQKYHVDAAKIANTHNTTVAKLLGSALTAAGSLAGKESSANIAAKARVRAAETTANKPERQTDFERRLAIRVAANMRDGMSKEDAEAAAERQITYGTPAAAGVTARTVDQADDAFTRFALLNRNAKAYIAKYGGEENARKIYIADYMRDALPPEMRPVLNTTPAAPKPTTAPAAAPAAGGKVATRADIAATAARTGKSEAEVIEAAKAKGYTIQ